MGGVAYARARESGRRGGWRAVRAALVLVILILVQVCYMRLVVVVVDILPKMAVRVVVLLAARAATVARLVIMRLQLIEVQVGAVRAQEVMQQVEAVATA